jgi:AGZA family xanthine/uracil permease-like MFS transporter
VGIGLFIALIGLHNSGIITASKETLVTMGNLRSPNTLLAIFGLMLISSLLAWEIRGAILIGILGITAAGIAFGLVRFEPQSYSFADITATAFHLNIRGALSYGLVKIVFVFLFVDLFDNIGTLVAVGKKAKLFDEANRIPRMNKILYCDATATVIGSLAGTSTVTSYVESAAGVAAGGRSGVTAIVTGILFLMALFVAPLVGAIPAAATAPALIVVGSMMIVHATEIPRGNPVITVPAFLTIVTIPLTFSNCLQTVLQRHSLVRPHGYYPKRRLSLVFCRLICGPVDLTTVDSLGRTWSKMRQPSILSQHTVQ